jgi:urease beta subunit
MALTAFASTTVRFEPGTGKVVLQLVMGHEYFEYILNIPLY